MKFIPKNYIFFLLFILTACFSRENKEHLYVAYQYGLVNSSEITFDLDSITPYKSENYQVFELQNQEYIALQSTNKNSVLIYSLESGNLFKEINIPKEGPQ